MTATVTLEGDGLTGPSSVRVEGPSVYHLACAVASLTDDATPEDFIVWLLEDEVGAAEIDRIVELGDSVALARLASIQVEGPLQFSCDTHGSQVDFTVVTSTGTVESAASAIFGLCTRSAAIGILMGQRTPPP